MAPPDLQSTTETAADEAPEQVTEPAGQVTEPGGAPAPEDLVEADLMVEDVSIDGMCGVY
jgi:mycofactocin precursor